MSDSVTPQTAAHQALPSLGFSRQEHWSGLPFPSPMHESEKWKWSRSVVSDPQRHLGLQPTRLLCPWDFPGRSTGVGCHCLLQEAPNQWGSDWRIRQERPPKGVGWNTRQRSRFFSSGRHWTKQIVGSISWNSLIDWKAYQAENQIQPTVLIPAL